MKTTPTAEEIAEDCRSAARVEERARIAAILTCPAAEGRERRARHLAFATDLCAPAAIEILAVAPLDAPLGNFPAGVH